MSRVRVEKLGEHTSLISSGSTPLGGSQVYLTNGPVLFIRSQNVLMNQLDLENAVYISDEMDQKIGRTRLQADDVLLNITGASIGRVATFDGQGKRANVNQHVCVIRPNPHVLNARYLSCFIATPECQQSIQQVQAGGTRQALTFSQIANFEVPLPPVAEQRRIAEVLDRAEALRAKRRAALAQFDTLTQSIFLDLFGDPATNPRAWPCVAFGDLGENQDSQRIPVKSSDREGRKGQYPYYGASGIIDWVDEYIFDGARLLVGEDGANLIARATPVAYIARGKYWVNNHAHVVAENGRADLRFLEHFIERLDLKPFISGTAQPKLNRSNLDRISVPLPPLPMQRSFALRVAALEKLKSTYRSSLAAMDSLFAVLQHRAFRGEL